MYPNDAAPIISLHRDLADKNNQPSWTPARFGLVPMWAKDETITKLSRMAYNARTETVAVKPMFRSAWQRSQFCLIPADAFYEPNWE